MNDRKQQIQDIVSIYVNRFTSAVMSDMALVEEKRYCQEANNWMRAQISANGITKEEMREALEACEENARAKGTACVYDLDMMK